MKPLNVKNYGSIPHLSNSKLGEKDYHIHFGQEKILTQKVRNKHDTILVFEKYDGSNVGVAKKEGKIYALTRSGYEANTSLYNQHHEFAEWVSERTSLFDNILNEGERVVGEWLYQSHGIQYTIKGEPIVFFDYFDNKNQRYCYNILQQTGLPFPRMLHYGEPVKVEDLLPVLNMKDCYIKSEENPEGMVYRVERKGKVDFLAKWVREDFVPGKYIIGKEEKDFVYNKIIKL